jgi:hypothetical protein
VLQFLGKQSEYVRSVSLRGARHISVTTIQLPPNLQLSSLTLDRIGLQLGVLASPALAALKQLRLRNFRLDHGHGPAAAEALLPAGLEHLSILQDPCPWPPQFPTAVLQQLSHLTYLELAGNQLQASGPGQDALQPLQGMTRLVDLRRRTVSSVTAGDLSGTCNLARLDLSGCRRLTPGALAGKTKLQHLRLQQCDTAGDATGPAQLLSHLERMQQLTHSDVQGSFSFG